MTKQQDTLVGEIGNIVTGEKFWGRDKELSHLLELIKEGSNVSIIAQRRMGKSSLMHEAALRLPSNVIALHMDVQAAKTPADFVARLTVAAQPYAPLWGRVKSVFSNILQLTKENLEAISISELEFRISSGLSGDNWRDKGAQVLAALAAHEEHVVLFIDELPIMIARILDDESIDGKNVVYTLLSWLRQNAQEYAGRLSMVFAGSIGFEPVLHRAGITATINHLTPFCLPPWSESEALGCLRALAAHNHIDLPDGAAKRMLELLGCNIPHHVQLFFGNVRTYCSHNDHLELSDSIIGQIFEQNMLGSHSYLDLVHMEERLRKTFHSNEFPLVMDILTQASITGHIGQEEIYLLCDRHAFPEKERGMRLPAMFAMLEHDGYVRKTDGNRFVFESKLLRRWWKARFEAFFQPVNAES